VGKRVVKHQNCRGQGQGQEHCQNRWLIPKRQRQEAAASLPNGSSMVCRFRGPRMLLDSKIGKAENNARDKNIANNVVWFQVSKDENIANNVVWFQVSKDENIANNVVWFPSKQGREHCQQCCLVPNSARTKTLPTMLFDSN
jgi:hypothetical protein